jgi:hypothetical protein
VRSPGARGRPTSEKVDVRARRDRDRSPLSVP